MEVSSTSQHDMTSPLIVMSSSSEATGLTFLDGKRKASSEASSPIANKRPKTAISDSSDSDDEPAGRVKPVLFPEKVGDPSNFYFTRTDLRHSRL
jgi:hypothetical protein